MKNKLVLALLAVLLPSAVLAAAPDQCALNSTCSFTIRGKFNKELLTSDIQSGKTYVCHVIRGSGKVLSVQNVYASKGVTYNLQGSRLDKPLIIRGPQSGTGYIRYTIRNNNDPWHTDSIQFKCKAK